MGKIVLATFLFLYSYSTCACNCKEFTQDQEWRNSELVFIGRITEKNKDNFEVQVIEIFKNSTFTEQVVFRVEESTCSIIPSKGELWLIYGHLRKGILSVSSCGYSNSLSFNSKKGSSKILPPRPLNYTKEEHEIVMSLYDSRIADQLFFTVNGLRIQKLEELIRIQNLEAKIKYDSLRYDRVIIYVLVLLVLISLAMNFFVLRRLSKISR